MMRLALLFMIAGFSSSSVWAHHSGHYYQHQSHTQCLNNHVYIAQTYPNQIAAAVQWRSRYPHADINLHIGLFNQYGWHPCVVAMLHYPEFLAQLHIGYKWKYRSWYKPKYHHYRTKPHYRKPYKKYRKKYWKKHYKHNKKRARVRER